MKFVTLKYFFINLSLSNVVYSYKNFSPENFEQTQQLTGKKIQFQGNSTQFLKFEVKLSYTPEFVLCLWYKPDTILERNILFFYGNADQQHILWEIKKKRDTSFIVLTLSESIAMEEKLENLQLSKWNHLCQYWQSSTGFWTFFLNNQLISFGYLNTTKKLSWNPKQPNIVAAINHPHTKGTLHGEVYGFYMITTNFLSENFQQSNASHIFPTDVLTNNQKLEKSRLQKRQVSPTNPANSSRPLPLRFRIRNIFKFIRRMVSFITVPVFRFAMRLIQPWRRRLISPRPLSSNRSNVTVATEIMSNLHVVVTAKNETKSSKMKNKEKNNNEAPLENSTKSYAVTKIVSNTFVESANGSITKNLTISSVWKKGNDIQKDTKCTSFEKKLNGNIRQPAETNYVTTSTEDPIDIAIPTRAFILFSQMLYLCCTFHHESVLISWEDTYVNIYEAAVADAKECGKF